MSQLTAKQIAKLLSSFVGLTAVSVVGASSVSVTAALTTALSTAGDGGVAVPLQQGSASQEGVLVGAGNNVVPVWDSATKDEIFDAGDQVYGRVVFSSPNYVVGFFKLLAGVETAVALNQSVDLGVPYRFSFLHLPADALISWKDLNAGSEVSPGNFFAEPLTVTGNNTISNLARTPINPTTVRITVNGQVLYAGTHFTVTGPAISISGPQSTAIGYTIQTTDYCVAEYWA